MAFTARHCEKNGEDLKRELDAGHPCMVSVASFFQGGKPKPDGSGVYGKSGHLVPVLGYETEDGRLDCLWYTTPSAFWSKTSRAGGCR